MAKNFNPADAHRKQQRQKELKKNKEDRKKTREVATVKKDTTGIEAEIRKLSGRHGLNAADQAQLAELKAELAKIMKAKNDYVAAHPEHRKFVFPESKTADSSGANNQQNQREPPGLYNRDGKLKHPERSLYFDPVFNPFGAPPPGMPYRERPPTAAEIAAWNAPPPIPVGESEDDSSSDDDGEDGDDIVMPEGAPPPPTGLEGDGESDSSGDDSDGIELPEGPPPPKPPQTGPLVPRPPRGPRHQPYPNQRPNGQRFPPGGPHGHHPLPPPPGFRGNFHPNQPRPPPGAPSGPRNPHALPSRPPPPANVHDPLALDGQPQQTYQAFKQGQAVQAGPSQPFPPPPGGLPPPPPPGAGPGAGAGGAPGVAAVAGPVVPAGVFVAPRGAAAGATISAAPVLRDLKKEATAFVPSNMRKKLKAQQATAAAAGLVSVNAAPKAAGAAGGEGGDGEARKERASLLGALKGVGIGGKLPPPKGGAQGQGAAAAAAGTDDYARFEEEMKDFL